MSLASGRPFPFRIAGQLLELGDAHVSKVGDLDGEPFLAKDCAQAGVLDVALADLAFMPIQRDLRPAVPANIDYSTVLRRVTAAYPQ